MIHDSIYPKFLTEVDFFSQLSLFILEVYLEEKAQMYKGMSIAFTLYDLSIVINMLQIFIMFHPYNFQN